MLFLRNESKQDRRLLSKIQNMFACLGADNIITPVAKTRYEVSFIGIFSEAVFAGGNFYTTKARSCLVNERFCYFLFIKPLANPLL